MPDWLQQWFTQNAPWLYPLAAVVTILTGVEIFFKPLRWVIPKLWSFLSRTFKTGAKRNRVTLRFVSMNFPHSQWAIGSQGNKPILVIVTRWHVTHEPGSGSGLPVRLLKVHPLKPFAEEFIHGHVVTMSDEYPNTRLETVIPEGQTRELIIRCHLSKVLKTEKPLKVHLAVEDQLANKHKLPPITVLPVPVSPGQ